MNKANFTLEELFILFVDKKFKRLGISVKNQIKTTFNKYTIKYHKYKYKELTAANMQHTIDECNKGFSTQQAIRNFWCHMDRFAKELNITHTNFSQIIKVNDTQPESTKQPYTDEEIKILWQNSDDYTVKLILIYLYTGFRLNELLNIKIENVDLENRLLKGGLKQMLEKTG